MNAGFRKFLVFSCMAILAFSLVLVGGVSAQLISGNIVGTVLDKTGAVVPHAKVEAVNTETGSRFPTESNDTGDYRLNNLPVGVYTVSATSDQFATTTVNGFKVELNKTITLPITLEVKGAVTSIEVSGTAETLDTTTATLSNTYEQKQVSDLPTASIGSGVLNLSLLGAGVANAGALGAGSGPAIGGQRPRNNNFTVEGIDNNSQNLCPEMGQHYPNMCASEANGIVAYLKSIPAVVNAIPASCCPPQKGTSPCSGAP